jgi:hypothetical protein
MTHGSACRMRGVSLQSLAKVMRRGGNSHEALGDACAKIELLACIRANM